MRLLPVVTDPDEGPRRGARPPTSRRAAPRRPGPSPDRARRSARRGGVRPGRAGTARTSATIWASPPERSRLDLLEERAIAAQARPAGPTTRLRIEPPVAVGLERERVPQVVLHAPVEQGGPLVEVDHLPAVGGDRLARDGAALPVGSTPRRAGRAGPGPAAARSSPRPRGPRTPSRSPRFRAKLTSRISQPLGLRVAPADAGCLDGRVRRPIDAGRPDRLLSRSRAGSHEERPVPRHAISSVCRADLASRRHTTSGCDGRGLRRRDPHRLEPPVGQRPPEPFGRAEAEVPQPDRADESWKIQIASTIAARPGAVDRAEEAEAVAVEERRADDRVGQVVASGPSGPRRPAGGSARSARPTCTISISSPT